MLYHRGLNFEILQRKEKNLLVELSKLNYLKLFNIQSKCCKYFPQANTYRITLIILHYFMQANLDCYRAYAVSNLLCDKAHFRDIYKLFSNQFHDIVSIMSILVYWAINFYFCNFCVVLCDRLYIE